MYRVALLGLNNKDIFPRVYLSFMGFELEISLSQGRHQFETSVFFSVKISISTTGGFRVGVFQPDISHP